MDVKQSLYEYLGKAAGEKIGKNVFTAAKAMNIKPSTRDISNPNYEGKVMTYPKEFLDLYFTCFKPTN